MVGSALAAPLPSTEEIVVSGNEGAAGAVGSDVGSEAGFLVTCLAFVLY